jgi:hypothetical protein
MLTGILVVDPGLRYLTMICAVRQPNPGLLLVFHRHRVIICRHYKAIGAEKLNWTLLV